MHSGVCFQELILKGFSRFGAASVCLPKKYYTQDWKIVKGKVQQTRSLVAQNWLPTLSMFLTSCRVGAQHAAPLRRGHFGGSVISMAQMAAGRMYMEAR